MIEKTYNLPADFFPTLNSDTNLYYYSTDISSKNNKIIFSQNLICLLIDGEKEVINNSDKIYIENDKFFLLTAGKCLMSEKIVTSKNYKSVLLFFSDEFLIDFITRQEINLSNYENKIQNLIEFEKDSFITNYENSLLILEHSTKNSPELIATKVKEILFYLLEKNTKEMCVFFKNILTKNKNSTLKEIVEQHQNRNLTIEELAFLCNMSVSTFKRKFAECYQTTPKQFYIRAKMEKAGLLLRQNKKPSEIYYELEYENLSSFSNEFKKFFGVSPKNYLNKI